MKNNKSFSKDLEERTKKFAVQIIKLVSKIASNEEGRIIRSQLVKSATSIGANYREANRAVSRADFRNKISICEKESSETQYWLELIQELNFLPEKYLDPVLLECSELLAIFTTIGRNSKKTGK